MTCTFIPCFLCLPGVEGPVGGDPVDGQQRAVERDERLHRGRPDRLGECRGEVGQEADGLGDVAVGGGDPDAEPGRELGVGVAAAQMGQNQEGLAFRCQAPPARADLPAVGGQLTGEVAQVRVGQTDRRRVDKHAKLLVRMGDRGREPVYQELCC